MTEMEKARTEIVVQGDLDALQMAVMNFIGRSSVAAVEMGIEELLEGHPLQEVWTRLLETRDIACVADLYGLSVTDLTAIRGFGPVAVGDIISAVNDKQPWKFRLAPGCLDIDADDQEDEKPAAVPCGATDLAGIIGDDQIVSALAEAGITGIDDLVIFTIGELAAIEGVGEEGANLIMERTDEVDLEMPLADGDKGSLVAELAERRAEADALAAEIEKRERELGSLADGPSDDEVLDSIAERLSELDLPAPEERDAAPSAGHLADARADEEQSGVPEKEPAPDSLAGVLASVRHGALLAELLADEGMTCVDDLMGMSVSDLASIDGIGQATAAQIADALEERGFAGYVSRKAADIGDAGAQVALGPEPVGDPFGQASSAPAPVSLEPRPLSPAMGAAAVPPEQTPTPFATQPHASLDPVYAHADVPAAQTAQASVVHPQAPSPFQPQAPSPDHTVPMPAADEPRESGDPDGLMPRRGTWTPDGFVPEDGDEEDAEADDEDDDVEETALSTTRAGRGKGRIALFAGVGMVVIALALGCGLMLGGNLAHADAGAQPVDAVATVDASS